MNRKKMYGWYVVFINAIIGCVLSAGFPQSSMSIPYLSEVSGISQEALLFGDTVRTIGITIGMLVSGFFYKKLGSKKTFIMGMVLLMPGFFIIPYAKSILVIYALKFMQGISSIIFPIFLIEIMNWIDEENRGLSTAVFNGIFYGGAGIGGTFCAFVIANFGWKESYWVLAIIHIVLAVLWVFTVKESTKAVEGDAEETSAVSFGDIVKMPVLWLLIVALISTTWSVQAISVDMPLFASYLGYNEAETGTILSAITIGIVAACVFSGKASDFFASRAKNKGLARVWVLAAGCVIVIASVIMLLMMDLTKFNMFYIVVLCFSFGASWGLGSFYSILPDIFDGDAVPVVTGFAGGCGDAGMILAPVVVGIAFGFKGFWNIGWGICIAVAAISLVACLLIIGSLKRIRR